MVYQTDPPPGRRRRRWAEIAFGIAVVAGLIALNYFTTVGR